MADEGSASEDPVVKSLGLGQLDGHDVVGGCAGAAESALPLTGFIDGAVVILRGALLSSLINHIAILLVTWGQQDHWHFTVGLVGHLINQYLPLPVIGATLEE